MSLCVGCGNPVIDGTCACPTGEERADEKHEIGRLRAKAEGQRRELESSHAEILDLRRLMGPYSTVEIALKMQEASRLQVADLKRIAEDAMAAYRQECYAVGKEANEPLEERFQATVRGTVKRVGRLDHARGVCNEKNCPECAAYRASEKRVEDNAATAEGVTTICQHKWFHVEDGHCICELCKTIRDFPLV